VSEALGSERAEAAHESKRAVLQLQEVSPGVEAASSGPSSRGGPLTTRPAVRLGLGESKWMSRTFPRWLHWVGRLSAD